MDNITIIHFTMHLSHYIPVTVLSIPILSDDFTASVSYKKNLSIKLKNKVENNTYITRQYSDSKKYQYSIAKRQFKF